MENLNFEDATVLFCSNYLEQNQSDKIFNDVSNIFREEVPNEIEYKEKMIKLNRKTLVYIDKNLDKTVIPKIWGKNIKIYEFTEDLIQIKKKLEEDLNFKFNICLANYYDTGKNTIGFHSDDEEKGSNSCIASLSIGAERKIAFRKKNTKEIYKEINLPSKNLLVMASGTQENYQHSIIVDKECKKPRLNLTFRLFDDKRYSSK